VSFITIDRSSNDASVISDRLCYIRFLLDIILMVIITTIVFVHFHCKENLCSNYRYYNVIKYPYGLVIFIFSWINVYLFPAYFYFIFLENIMSKKNVTIDRSMKGLLNARDYDGIVELIEFGIFFTQVNNKNFSIATTN